jgi:hypothetical protein
VGRGARDSGCNTLSVGTPTFTPSSGAAGGGGRKRDFDGTPLRCQGLSLRWRNWGRPAQCSCYGE